MATPERGQPADQRRFYTTRRPGDRRARIATTRRDDEICSFNHGASPAVRLFGCGVDSFSAITATAVGFIWLAGSEPPVGNRTIARQVGGASERHV
jgi:hypothetical protein